VTRSAAGAKRALDLAVAMPLLLVAALPMLAIAIVVRIVDGAPVLFRQTRPGRHGRPFTLLKFRTMRPGDAADDLRLTRLGGVLRATSLDELPQLWNVLRGEMSLVGPRPLLPQYLSRYSARQARRHEVPPGITGLAQVEGRNSLSWDEKLELDVRYVEQRTLALDVQLIARTVLAVIARRGVSADGHATMPEFFGTAGAEARHPAVLRTE
jgi:lipopolysaccharide/colanic/teichoic acid biosynthesis glycosyltransferase